MRHRGGMAELGYLTMWKCELVGRTVDEDTGRHTVISKMEITFHVYLCHDTPGRPSCLVT